MLICFCKTNVYIREYIQCRVFLLHVVLDLACVFISWFINTSPMSNILWTFTTHSIDFAAIQCTEYHHLCTNFNKWKCTICIISNLCFTDSVDIQEIRSTASFNATFNFTVKRWIYATINIKLTQTINIKFTQTIKVYIQFKHV